MSNSKTTEKKRKTSKSSRLSSDKKNPVVEEKEPEEIVESEEIEDPVKDEVPETIFEEIEEKDIPPQLVDTVYSWIDTIGYQEETFKTTLYKFQGRSTIQKEICFQWTDVIPDAHEIGEMFGSGLYHIFINFQGSGIQRKTKAIRFRLHKIYDSIKEEKDRNGGSNRFRAGNRVDVNNNNGGNSNSMYDTVMILKELASIFVPLMTQGQQQIHAPQPEATSKHLAGIYKDVGDVLKSSMLDNIQTYNDMQRENMNLPQTVETEEEAKPTFIEQAMPIIESIIKPLMNMPTAAAIPYASQIRKNPEFKKLQTEKFKKERNQLVQHMIKTYGEKETIGVLKKLKMKV